MLSRTNIEKQTNYHNYLRLQQKRKRITSEVKVTYTISKSPYYQILSTETILHHKVNIYRLQVIGKHLLREQKLMKTKITVRIFLIQFNRIGIL